MRKFRTFSLVTLLYTLIVILWGAFVRISHSGDGCGDSWPLCKEQLIPSTSSLPTWIEFSHRVSSGLFMICIFALVVSAFYWMPKRHWLRKWVFVILFFTLTEAGVGAVLVLKGLVGDNTSLFRAYVMGIHMLNSMALVASIAIAYWGATGGWILRQQTGRFVKVYLMLLAGFLLIASTGALAALAGTLFPSDSLMEGLMKDFSKDSHILVRLRIWHPMFATVIGGGLFIMTFYKAMTAEDARVNRQAWFLMAMLAMALIFGYWTLFALSPTWMKLGHLLMAHLLWLSLLRFGWHLYACRKWQVA